MSAAEEDDAVRRTVAVDAPPERAFAVFTDLDAWWPPEFTWSQGGLEAIRIEPAEGGHCFERGPHGFTVHWGRVLAWEPSSRIVFTWQIGPDRVPEPDTSMASEVEVRFTPDGAGGTRVEIEHRGFARHGEAGAGYRAGMERGWDHLAERFAAALA